jgi:hypothetical protein
LPRVPALGSGESVTGDRKACLEGSTRTKEWEMGQGEVGPGSSPPGGSASLPSPGCLLSVHGTPGPGAGHVDRSGGCHAGERLPLVHPWLPYQ